MPKADTTGRTGYNRLTGLIKNTNIESNGLAVLRIIVTIKKLEAAFS